MESSAEFKVKEAIASGSASGAYRALMYGDVSFGRFLWSELLFTFISGIGGALGLWLRMKLYPALFKSCGKKVVFGRHVVIRHPHKITLGDGVVLDDGSVVDAKGTTNEGITLGNRVYVGRNSIIYCKNGDIIVGDNVSISANSILFSSNRLEIKKNGVIASFVYVLSGGEYDIHDTTPFAFQKGTCTKGPLAIEEGCWLGAGAKILDGANLGERCVVAAGAVVVRSMPGHCVVGGVPAKIIKELTEG